MLSFSRESFILTSLEMNKMIDIRWHGSLHSDAHSHYVLKYASGSIHHDRNLRRQFRAIFRFLSIKMNDWLCICVIGSAWNFCEAIIWWAVKSLIAFEYRVKRKNIIAMELMMISKKKRTQKWNEHARKSNEVNARNDHILTFEWTLIVKITAANSSSSSALMTSSLYELVSELKCDHTTCCLFQSSCFALCVHFCKFA